MVRMEEPLYTILLVLTLLVMVVGLIGTVTPVLPGTVLIFLAALIYALVEGFRTVGWPTLLVLGLLTLIATSADLWASAAGAKAGGASGWSVLAGLAGGLVGFILFTLPGGILGAVVGVLLSEMLRLGDWKKALKAGSGWLLGWVLSAILQLSIGLVMVALFIWQVIQGPE